MRSMFLAVASRHARTVGLVSTFGENLSANSGPMSFNFFLPTEHRSDRHDRWKIHEIKSHTKTMQFHVLCSRLRRLWWLRSGPDSCGLAFAVKKAKKTFAAGIFCGKFRDSLRTFLETVLNVNVRAPQVKVLEPVNPQSMNYRFIISSVN